MQSTFRATVVRLTVAIPALLAMPCFTSAAPPDYYIIEFMDSTDGVVGTGQFRINRDGTRCVERVRQDDCASDNRGRGKRLDTGSALVEFNAVVRGLTWQLDQVETLWWAEGNERPGQQKVMKGQLYGTDSDWLFGDRVAGTRTLRMQFTRVNRNSGNGTWELMTNEVDGQPPSVMRGTWSGRIDANAGRP